RRQLHDRARAGRRGGARRGALLLPDAPGRLAPRVRCGPRQEPDRGEPRLLRRDGARPSERHLPRRRAGARDRLAGRCESRGAGPAGRAALAEAARRLSEPRGGRRRRARTAPRHRLPRGAGPDRPRVVSQVPRARRAGGGGAARAGSRPTSGAGERPLAHGRQRPGQGVAVRPWLLDRVLPATFRDAEYVFLGNIDPELQLGVLDQVKAPKLVACDTMNYWIQSKRDLLLELLRHIDILMVNDSEARELSGDWNIYRAAQWI